MVDAKTKGFLERMVKQYCTPDTLHSLLAHFESQAEETEGGKKLVCEAWVEGIKKVLGKVS